LGRSAPLFHRSPVMAGPVPAIHAFSARGVKTWMAGTSPAMTARVWCGRVRCSHFVLDSQYKLSYIVVHPRLTRGALARRRSEEAGAVPPQVSQTCDRGWPILACPGPLKQTAHDEQFGSSFPPSAASRIARRATLDPSSGSQRKLRARRRTPWRIERKSGSRLSVQRCGEQKLGASDGSQKRQSIFGSGVVSTGTEPARFPTAPHSSTENRIHLAEKCASLAA